MLKMNPGRTVGLTLLVLALPTLSGLSSAARAYEPPAEPRSTNAGAEARAVIEAIRTRFRAAARASGASVQAFHDGAASGPKPRRAERAFVAMGGSPGVMPGCGMTRLRGPPCGRMFAAVIAPAS